MLYLVVAVTLVGLLCTFIIGRHRGTLTAIGDCEFACVTGCTSGLGLAFVRILASRGFNLILVARDGAALEVVKTELLIQHPSLRIECVTLDLRDQKTLIEKMTACFSRLKPRILINNAGMNVAYPKFLTEHTESEIGDILAVNLVAPILLSRIFYKSLPTDENAPCFLINIGSLLGTTDAPMLAVYAASKRGLDTFSASLVPENTRVKVFCATPAWLVTKMSGIRQAKLKRGFITPEMCADRILSDAVDCSKISGAGHWLHCLIEWTIMLMPRRLRLDVIFSRNHKVYERMERKLLQIKSQ